MLGSDKRERELAAQGWTRRAMLNQPRLGEVVEQYRALGFEVRLEPADPSGGRDSDGCGACLGQPETAGQYKVVFTRPAGPAGGDS